MRGARTKCVLSRRVCLHPAPGCVQFRNSNYYLDREKGFIHYDHTCRYFGVARWMQGGCKKDYVEEGCHGIRD